MADTIRESAPDLNPELIVTWMRDRGVDVEYARRLVYDIYNRDQWRQFARDPDAYYEWLQNSVAFYENLQAQKGSEKTAQAGRESDREAQQKHVDGYLRATGFLKSGVSFEQALADYQRDRKINAGNAVLDKPTLAKIDEELKFIAGQNPPSGGGGGAPSAATQAAAGGGALRRGAKGDEVKRLQEALNAHGARLVVDGDFGPATEAAVNEFKRTNGLEVDGVASSRMWERLGAAPAGSGGGAPATGGGAVPATAGAAPPATTGATGAGDPNADGRYTIPGGGQIWAAPDNYWYVVYTVPGTGTPLAWRIENNDDVAAIFGPGNQWKVDRTLSQEEWAKAGVLTFGSSRQLANLNKHPFDAFQANFETEARVRPWLKDPEVLALTMRAILENRDVTEGELASTKWWQNHTEGERQWISTAARDPSTARQMVQDSHDKVRALMIKSGLSDPPEKLVELIGNRLTAGTWSAEYVQNQVAKLADPYAPGAVDPTLAIWVSDLKNEGVKFNTLADNTDKVGALIRTWLGPAYENGISKQQREIWAGRLRNDPQAEEEITAELRRKRLSLFPEYEDERLSYEDIASTWRGVWSQMWGEAPDEKDPLFQQIVRMNDLHSAQETLRREGLSRGNGQVVQQGLEDLGAVLGTGVRRAL